MTIKMIKLAQGEGVVRNVSASGIYFVTDVAAIDSFEFLGIPRSSGSDH